VSIRDVRTGQTWRVGSHWNRKKLTDKGTGIYWDEEKAMWEVKVVRHGGYFKDIIEASNVLQNLIGVNEHDFLVRSGMRLHDQLEEPQGAIEGEVTD
jgi:hypothetical protein